MWNRAPSTGTVQCYHRTATATQPLTNHLKSRRSRAADAPRPPLDRGPPPPAPRPSPGVGPPKRSPPDHPARNPTVSGGRPGRSPPGRSPPVFTPHPAVAHARGAGAGKPGHVAGRPSSPPPTPATRNTGAARHFAVETAAGRSRPPLPIFPSRGVRRRAPPRERRRRPAPPSSPPSFRRPADRRTTAPAPLRHPPAPAEAGPRHRARRLAGECDCGLVEMAGSAVRVRRRPRRLAGECDSAGSRRPGLAARSRRGRTRRRLSRTIRRAPVRAAASAATA